MATVDAMSARAPASPVVTKRARSRPLPRTTPAWLRVAAATLAIGTVVLGLVGARVAVDRLDAAKGVGLEATPLLLQAENLYVALADADAAASTAFLRAGLEPPELRARYDTDVDLIGRYLAEISSQRGLASEAKDAVATITEAFADYTALVADARANSRQDFPVGAAYLRQASGQMHDVILPAATLLYERAAGQLHGAYRSGTAAGPVVMWAVVACAVLGVLVITQVFLSRRTRRILNLGLVAATVLVVALSVWAANAFTSGQRALAAAQEEGSDHFLVLSAARILTLRSMSDENLDLIERGTASTYLDDFGESIASIGDNDEGLLGWAGDIVDRTGMDVGLGTILDRHDAYLALHEEVRALERQARYVDAVDLAVGAEAAAAATLDDAYEASIASAHGRLESAAADARHALRGLTTTMAVVAALAGLVAVLGLDRRIREYR
jgi:hypothetical protein